jgi:tungstate transport system substrate-binding protein
VFGKDIKYKMKSFSRFLGYIILIVISFVSFTSCNSSKSIILATTTSTRDSGLLDAIIPGFEEEYGIEVKVVAVGTGKALQMGIDGEADVLLVHDRESEEQFIEDGHGLKHYDVMYNDFILIGPKNDSLNLKENSNNNILEALDIISKSSKKFISRGDNSGTHKKELSLWEELGFEPEGDFYVSTGRGMSDVIVIADEMEGYTLADRATYLFLKAESNIDLEIIVGNDEMLFNQYGVINVNPNKNERINKVGADKFIKWILSVNTQKLIGEYGKERFGSPLFTPNAE